MPLNQSDRNSLEQYRDRGRLKGLAITNMINEILSKPVVYNVDRNSINDFAIRGREITNITGDVSLGMPFETMVLEINQFFRYKLTFFDIRDEVNGKHKTQSYKNLMKNMLHKGNAIYLEKVYLQNAFTHLYMDRTTQKQLGLMFDVYEDGLITSLYDLFALFINDVEGIHKNKCKGINGLSISDYYTWADSEIRTRFEDMNDVDLKFWSQNEDNNEDYSSLINLHIIKQFCTEFGKILLDESTLELPLEKISIKNAICKNFEKMDSSVLSAIKKAGMLTEKDLVRYCFGKSLRKITGDIIEEYNDNDSFFSQMVGHNNSKKVIIQYRIGKRKEFHIAYLSNNSFLNNAYRVNAINTSENVGVQQMIQEILYMLNGFGYAWENRCVITTEKTTTRRVRVSKKSKRKVFIRETQRVLSYNTDVGEMEIEKTKIINTNTDETPKGTGLTKCPHTRREHFAYCWIKESNTLENDVWYDVKESKNGQCMLVKVRRKRRSANIHCGGSINGEIRSN